MLGLLYWAPRRADQGFFHPRLSDPTGLRQAWQGQGHPRGSWPAYLPFGDGIQPRRRGPSAVFGAWGREDMICYSAKFCNGCLAHQRRASPHLCLPELSGGILSRSPFRKLAWRGIKNSCSPLIHTHTASHPRPLCHRGEGAGLARLPALHPRPLPRGLPGECSAGPGLSWAWGQGPAGAGKLRAYCAERSQVMGSASHRPKPKLGQSIRGYLI